MTRINFESHFLPVFSPPQLGEVAPVMHEVSSARSSCKCYFRWSRRAPEILDLQGVRESRGFVLRSKVTFTGLFKPQAAPLTRPPPPDLPWTTRSYGFFLHSFDTSACLTRVKIHLLEKGSAGKPGSDAFSARRRNNRFKK